MICILGKGSKYFHRGSSLNIAQIVLEYVIWYLTGSVFGMTFKQLPRAL